MVYTQNQPIGYTENQPVAYTQIHPIAHTQNQPIAHTQNQQIAHTQNQPVIQLAQEHTDNPGTRAAYNRPIGYEEKSYLCSWCETPTKFKDRKKLSKHIKRFHNAFDQKNKGTKRGDDDLDEIAPKRHRGDNKYDLFEYGDDDDDDGYDDNNENNDNNDSEERNEDDNDVGSDEPQIRFDSSRSVMR